VGTKPDKQVNDMYTYIYYHILSNSKLDFLDVTIIKTDGILSIDIFWKPTAKDTLYMRYLKDIICYIIPTQTSHYACDIESELWPFSEIIKRKDQNPCYQSISKTIYCTCMKMYV
jgi:hypothetical protein